MHPSGRLAFRGNVPRPRGDHLPCFEAGEDPVAWEQVVAAGCDGEVEVEIGCGKGAFLVAAAAARPGARLVGVEASRAYARYAAGRIARRGLANAVVVADDARLFLEDTVPRQCLARVHVYYPDPWPKRRHRKRRLFAPGLPDLVARALRPGGELLVATDNTRYFGEILAVLGSGGHLVRSREAEQRYGDEVPGVAFGPTNFSDKYRAQGRPRHRAVWVNRRPGTPSMHETGTDSWVHAADLAAIPAEEGLAVVCAGRDLALFRNGDRVVCLEDSCPHRGAALADGTVRDGEVICPWHGWRFGLDDGACSTLPGSMPARTFTVRVDGDAVFVRV